MEKSADNTRADWTREARRVARRVNFGWWLQCFTPALVSLGLGGAATLLVLRRTLPALPAWQAALGILALLLAAAGVAWLVARRRFESVESSMVRIEAAMRLRNGLSAARAGVAPWPALPSRVDAGLSWNWQRVVIPPAATLLFLAAGLLIPVAAVSGPATGPPDEPLAWKQIEADLERLAEDEVMDETYLEEMRKKLDELRAQDEEDWFSHSSLEATDSLKQQHHSEIERVERELGRADRALGNLQKNAGALSQAQKDQLKNQFDQALQGLQNGALKPNPDLLDALKGLDLSQLGQLSPEQLDQLRDNLKKARKAAGDAQAGDGAGDEWLDELLDGEDGNCPGGNCPGCGDKDCPNGQPGKGGVNRGPGHAPGVLGKQGDQLKGGDLEALEAKDLSNSLPGDLLQLEDGQHELDRTPTAPRGGGGIGTTGAGGDRVWKESLDPDEQRALKRFFE